MSEQSEFRRTLATAFEEVASLLDGMRELYPIPDEAIWDMARALDRIHERACTRCNEPQQPDEETDCPDHPAILFLHAQILSRGVEDHLKPEW